MLKLNENQVHTLLALWMLLNIWVYSAELFLLVIIAISFSELLLIGLDQIRLYMKRYAALVELEKDIENES